MPAPPTIRLLHLDAALSRAVADPVAFERATGATLGANAEVVRDVVAQGEAHRARTGTPDEWGAFLAVTTGAPAHVVGTCAFVSAPSAGGEVEIAYFTLPGFEGQGIGTAMARAIVAVAAERGVRLVFAHTLPETNASTSILEKNGFRRNGTAQDHEVGTVWRWERPARAADA